MQILSSQKHNNYVSLEIHKIKYSHIKSWFTVHIPNYILGAILWFWMKALCDMWASLLTCWLREFCNNYQRFFFKNQNQTWKRMLPCNIHYNYCKMTLKLMIFFVHSTYRFLIFVTRSKEIHERTATENFKPELPAFQFQICRTCKWFKCITHHMSNFPVSLFFMQNRSIIILWCFDWKLHALTISNGLLIDNRWSRTYNSVIWAAFVIFQWSLLNFQCF